MSELITNKTLMDTDNPLLEDTGAPLYILMDAEGCNENPVYGVFTKYEYAQKAADWLVKKMVEECLAVDPKESGIDAEFDTPWLERDVRNSLKIEPIPTGLNKVMF
jgi:hypothetical protein